MTPNQQSDEADLANVLRGLASGGLGVEEPALYDRLGSGIRSFWSIFPQDRSSPDLVRMKADCHINSCITMIDVEGRPPGPKKALLRAAFNLKEVPEAAKGLDFKERLRVLQAEPGDLKEVASYSTLDRMRGEKEHVFERMAQAMLENPLGHGQLAEEIRERFGVQILPIESEQEASAHTSDAMNNGRSEAGPDVPGESKTAQGGSGNNIYIFDSNISGDNSFNWNSRKTALSLASVGVVLILVVGLVVVIGEPWSSDQPQGEAETATQEPANADLANIDPAPAAPPGGSEPVFSTRVMRGNICEGGLMVPEKTIEEIGLPPEAERYDAGIQSWAQENHGAMSTVVGVGFTIQGSSEAAIVLEEIKVQVESPKEEAPDGLLLTYPCGEEIDTRFAVANLDDDPVTFSDQLPDGDQSLYNAQLTRRHSPMQFPYQVSMAEPEHFLLIPATRECSCEWFIRIRWSSMGEDGEIVIDDDGEPFHTISPSRMEPYELERMEGESWIPVSR